MSGAPLGRRRPGIREVAERAGVAISSVSRVLSGHPDVSDDMRERVTNAVVALGYRPDFLAQGLRRQKTMSIGFAASHLSNPVLAETIIGSERTLRGAGYSLLVTDAEGDPALDARHIDLLQQRRVDGLLLSPSDEQADVTIEAMRRIEVPFVLIDRDVPRGLEAAQVRFDHEKGMREAAEHLIALGHEHVALIVGGPRLPARERQLGIESVFERAGGSVMVLEGPFTIQHGVNATEQVLRSTPRPSALVAAGNVLMHGALRALRARNVTAGRDLSLVGCDDMAVAEFHEPPIAAIRRDMPRIGELAAELLLSRLGEGSAPTSLVLRTDFVAAPSCVPARRSKA